MNSTDGVISVIGLGSRRLGWPDGGCVSGGAAGCVNASEFDFACSQAVESADFSDGGFSGVWIGGIDPSVVDGGASGIEINDWREATTAVKLLGNQLVAFDLSEQLTVQITAPPRACF
ncbi:MAG: hypothetical protein JST54_15500 [Deltaproteobacteria bacterium]|nr:hypothetical protein [Deltaproteobacteria bacterium]